ncbi:MAG TPA: DUF309 domain-containing protein [Candidatus Acidoferrales bacterium]
MHQSDERQQFLHGIEQFNRREFFETHETWEAIWLAAPEPDKTFLQGIIQIACSFHHYLRGNRAGARSLLRRGLEKVERFPTDYRGMNVARLRKTASWWREELDAGRNPRPDKLPTIVEAPPG